MTLQKALELVRKGRDRIIWDVHMRGVEWIPGYRDETKELDEKIQKINEKIKKLDQQLRGLNDQKKEIADKYFEIEEKKYLEQLVEAKKVLDAANKLISDEMNRNGK